jgi:hypothetical protein
MPKKIGRLFPVGGPVPPDLIIGRAGEVDELERRVREELHTILVGPRRIGKTTVCEAVCDRARRSAAAVVTIEVPERPDSRALLQLMIDRCSRLSHEARGRRAAQVARPLIEKLLADLGVPLDLSVLGSGAALPTREVLSLPVRLAGAADRSVLVFFDELQRVVDYADGEQLLIDIVDVFSTSRGVSVLVDGSQERTLDAMLGPPTHLAKLCDRLQLDPQIPRETWREPLRERFDQAGQTIQADALEALLEFGDGRPYETMAAARYTALSARKLGSDRIGDFEVQMGIDEARRHVADDDG